MSNENILSNYKYYIVPQNIYFLHLKRDWEKIKEIRDTVKYNVFENLDNAIRYYNCKYGTSKFRTFLYEVKKEIIELVDGNLNGTLNFWNRKLKESESDMRYCTSVKNAVKYRNKLIEKDSKESKKNIGSYFYEESRGTSDTCNVVTQRIKYSSEKSYSREGISTYGVFYFVTRDLVIKSIELTAQTAIVAKVDKNIKAKIIWYDTKHNCWLRETKEEAIDDLIEILSKKLQVALES